MDQHALKDLRDELSNTIDRHSQTLAADLRRTGRDANIAAEDIGAVAARSGKVVAEEIRDVAAAGERDVRKTIAEHPFASMAAATGVGMLLAFAFRGWR